MRALSVPEPGLRCLAGLLGLGLLAACSARTYTDAAGHRYRLVEIPKVEGRYQVLPDGQVRVAPFQLYELARQDGSSLWVKVYETPPGSAAAPQPAREVAGTGEMPGAPPSARLALVPRGVGLPDAGQWRNDFALVDLDGDGRLDLVTAPPRKGGGHPVVLHGDGRGGFTRAAVSFDGPPADYGSVAVADLDGDGRPDIALAPHLGELVVYRNAGANGFVAGSLAGVGAPAGGRPLALGSVRAADWDRDGRVDLVGVAGLPGRLGPGPATRPVVRVLLNRGTSWVEQAGDPAGPAPFASALVVADLDGDATPDVLTNSISLGGTAVVHLARGPRLESRPLPDLHEQVLLDAVAVADLDADGRSDIALGLLYVADGAWRTGLEVHLATADGWRRRVVTSEPGRNRVVSLATGDLDGDGQADLVALRLDGTLETYPGDGAGFVTRDAVTPPDDPRAGCAGVHVLLADLDGDGHDEIVASFAGDGPGAGNQAACRRGGAIAAWHTVTGHDAAGRTIHPGQAPGETGEATRPHNARDAQDPAPAGREAARTEEIP